MTSRGPREAGPRKREAKGKLVLVAAFAGDEVGTNDDGEDDEHGEVVHSDGTLFETVWRRGPGWACGGAICRDFLGVSGGGGEGGEQENASEKCGWEAVLHRKEGSKGRGGGEVARKWERRLLGAEAWAGSTMKWDRSVEFS